MNSHRLQPVGLKMKSNWALAQTINTSYAIC